MHESPSSLKSWVKSRLSADARLSLRRFLNWPPVIDVGTIDDTVFLAGVGRSGTGWFSDVINYKNDYRSMYEPFGPKVLRAYPHFTAGRYIRPGTDDKQLLKYAALVLAGKMGHNRWVDQDNRRIVARRRLIKETHANLWLRWLKDNFPGVTIVLMFRHPIAVVHSRAKRGNLMYLDAMLAQEDLIADHLAPFKDILASHRDMSEFEQRTLMWCIEYYVPLRAMRRGEVHLSFYENVAEHPESELRRLFEFLGKTFDDSVHDALSRPSHVTKSDAAIMTGESIVAHWKEKVSVRDVDRAMAIVRRFGLDAVYTEDPLPNVAGAYGLLQPA